MRDTVHKRTCHFFNIRIKQWTRSVIMMKHLYRRIQRLTEAASASNAVHVSFPILWHIQVYHQVDFFCIYAPGSLPQMKRQKKAFSPYDRNKSSGDVCRMESVSPDLWRSAPCTGTASVWTLLPASGPGSNHLHTFTSTISNTL